MGMVGRVRKTRVVLLFVAERRDFFPFVRKICIFVEKTKARAGLIKKGNIISEGNIKQFL